MLKINTSCHLICSIYSQHGIKRRGAPPPRVCAWLEEKLFLINMRPDGHSSFAFVPCQRENTGRPAIEPEAIFHIMTNPVSARSTSDAVNTVNHLWGVPKSMPRLF